MFVHLLRQVFARFGIGRIEAILVYQHFLVLQPLPPGFFGYVVKYFLAEFPGIGGKIQAFGFPPEFDALHHSWHFRTLQKWASYCANRARSPAMAEAATRIVAPSYPAGTRLSLKNASRSGKVAKRNPHTGFRFDDFLKEERFFEEVQAKALKRALAEQLEGRMQAAKLTLIKAARALGK